MPPAPPTPLATMRLSYYPDSTHRERKADYLVITCLLVLSEDGQSSEVLAQIAAPYLAEPWEISLPGLPPKPDLLVICWAALSAFAVGAGAEDKELVVSLRDQRSPKKENPP